MASGRKEFVVKETLESLEYQTVDDLVNHIKTLPKVPEPLEVGKMYVPELRQRIDERNSTADKTDQWYKPLYMSSMAVARVMIAFDGIRRIKFASKTRDTENDLVGMYQPTGDNKGLYTYDENIIKSRIRAYAPKMNKHQVDEAYNYFMTEAPAIDRCTGMDLIPVNNGIFNYKTKQLQDFTPELAFLSKAWVDYNPNASNVHINTPDGDVWDCDSWMTEISSDKEQEQLLWELLSAVLRPYVPWNKAALFYSTKGNNGKGSVLHLMQQMLGTDAYASIPLSEMGDRFGLSPLLRAQAILVDENDVGTFVDRCAKFKAIVTGDEVSIDRKGKPLIKTSFSGLVVECFNETPGFKDKTDSITRRLLIVPFTKCFTGRERKYIKEDYLERKEVLEYFLKRALESDFYELSEPEICKRALTDYRIMNDPVVEFWDDVCDVLVWDMQPLAWLFELYKKWYENTHSKPASISSRRFREKLIDIATADGKWVFAGKDSNGNDKQVRVKDGAMDGTEPLIIEYDVEKFMNPKYKGVDMDKRCNFTRREKYRGCLLRNKNGIVVNDGDND